MTDWREIYQARAWDDLDNWWRHCEDLSDMRALFDQLRQDVPPQRLTNGMEERSVYRLPKEAKPGWEGAAEILYLGELEARIQGEPPDERKIWSDLSLEVSELMQTM